MTTATETGEREATPLFVLRGPQHLLETQGQLAALPSGSTASLGRRVAEFFDVPRSGPQMLVGALPFDPHAKDALYQPAQLTLSNDVQLAAGADLPALMERSKIEPAADYYADMVARCLGQLKGECPVLGKAVLARSVYLQATDKVHPLGLAQRLAQDASVTTYVSPLPVGPSEAPAWLVGATPELLISKRGNRIISHPLAGSARRSHDKEKDALIGEKLGASNKDLIEHAYVVDAIVAALAPLCSDLDAPSRPSLYTTDTMWHLGTRIVGTLKDATTSVATLAGLLHPTPAVCGTPRQLALDTIHQLEPVARGFYAGAVGWVDDKGEGDWYVAIRCAHVQANSLRLFAGAGIVADSEPALEVAETAAKFKALLNAFGMDEVHSH